MSIKTTHKIGDLVYTANAYDVDRDVIKAIKVEGVREKISYGIKSRKDNSLFALYWSGDGYNWYKPTEIFKTKEEAENLHNSLKAKKEADEAKEKAKERKKRLERLKREQEALEAGEDYDPYDEDDL